MNLAPYQAPHLYCLKPNNTSIWSVLLFPFIGENTEKLGKVQTSSKVVLLNFNPCVLLTLRHCHDTRKYYLLTGGFNAV